jgi:hypothetical protein
MAGDTRFFSITANCYAFAVKRQTTKYGIKTATPNGVNVADGQTTEQYYEALKNGVLADGGQKVKFLSQFSVQAVTSADIPTARTDWYLIAMLVNKFGFHFLRRQRKKAIGTPFWKWKEGNTGLEERDAYEMSSKKYIRVTDERFPELVKGTLVGLRGSYDKLFFFEVDQSGFNI